LTTLLEMAEAVRLAAGWSRTPEIQDQAAVFHPADGPSFRLTRHGERLAAFSADLGPWPEDEGQADELARRVGRLAAGTFGRRASVASTSSGRWGLHLPFDPSRTAIGDVPDLCAGFLNDLDWWRRNGVRP
jgi:hypothetical protein